MNQMPYPCEDLEKINCDSASREVTTEMIDHLPTDLHKAIARDYILRGLWTLKE